MVDDTANWPYKTPKYEHGRDVILQNGHHHHHHHLIYFPNHHHLYCIKNDKHQTRKLRKQNATGTGQKLTAYARAVSLTLGTYSSADKIWTVYICISAHEQLWAAETAKIQRVQTNQ